MSDNEPPYRDPAGIPGNPPPPPPYYAPPAWPPPPGGYYPPQTPQYPPVNATLVLVFGILSIVFSLICVIGGIFGPVAWIMGNSALTTLDQTGDPWGQRGTVQAGRICGIIGTILMALMILFFVAIMGFGIYSGIKHPSGV